MAQESKPNKKHQVTIQEYRKIQEKQAKTKLQLHFPLAVKVILGVPLAYFAFLILYFLIFVRFVAEHWLVTDLVIWLIFVFLLWRGAMRGALRSLLGPLGFVIATAAAFYYYMATKNIGISLAIGLLGPTLLTWLCNFLIQTVTTGQQPGLLSRCTGAMITACYGLLIIFPILFLLTFAPPLHPAIVAMNKDIKISSSYLFIKSVAKLFKIEEAGAKKTNASKGEQTAPPTMQTLAADERMQAIINDPEIVKAIETKNYAVLLSNPKVMALAQDPAFIQKMMAAYSTMTPADLPKPEPSEE